MEWRKELVLLLLTVALGAWIALGSERSVPRTALRPSPREYQPAPLPDRILAAPRQSVVVDSRDLFREPTEARPLPPRELDLPALAPLPVLRPPMPTGQAPVAWHQLRWTAEVMAEPHAFAAPELGAADEAPQASDQGPSLGDSYDLLQTRNGQRYYGYLELTDEVKYRLEETQTFREPIRMDAVSERTGEVWMRGAEFPADQIQRIELADTFRNRFERSRRKLGSGEGSFLPRTQLIEELLSQASAESWAWREAEDLASSLAAIRGGATEETLRWTVRVLRAQGDLAREWEFLHQLPEDMADSAFFHRQRGDILQRLGLAIEAEAALREAVSRRPDGPRSLSALARFLGNQGRLDEALEISRRAAGEARRLTEPERFDVARIDTELLLAAGNLPAARRALGRLGSPAGRERERSFLDGALRYAEGDFAAAEQRLRTALELGEHPQAQLGLGLCAMVQGEWDLALALLDQVARERPLLRAEAQSARAVLFERTGHRDRALAAAREAQQSAPESAFVRYVLGRQLRQSEQHAEAVEQLAALVADTEAAIAPYAETAYSLRSAAELEDGLARAARFADRAVGLDLDRTRAALFLELQGDLHYRLGEFVEARDAFAAAAELGSDSGRIGVAVIDYRQNRVDEARGRLAALANDPGGVPAVREFARNTLDAIEDHSSKELVRDDFEREDLGGLWPDTDTGGGQIVVRDGALQLRGSVRSEAYARRTLTQGSGLVQVQVDLQLGRGHDASSAGLRLRSASTSGRGAPEFEAWLVVQRRNQLGPELYLRDGREGGEAQPVPLDLPGFDPYGPQQLDGELVPAENDRLVLVLRWNGTEVLRQELQRLNRRTRQPLQIDLFCGAGSAEVRFDRFAMIRREGT